MKSIAFLLKAISSKKTIQVLTNIIGCVESVLFRNIPTFLIKQNQIFTFQFTFCIINQAKLAKINL